MKTDHALGELCAEAPQVINLLLNEQNDTRYEMFSPAFKQVERRMDACFRPVNDPNKPWIALEFQGYEDGTIYYRAFTTAGFLGTQQPDREVHIVLVFLSPRFDPKTQPWHRLGRSGFEGLRVIYLKEVVDRVERNSPGDPLAALLGVLVQEDVEDAVADAKRRYQIIQAAPLESRTRQVYVKLLLYWLYQRFSQMGPEEVKNMIGFMTPLEETRAYKEIAAQATAKLMADMTAKVKAVTSEAKAVAAKAEAEREKAVAEREKVKAEREKAVAENEKAVAENEKVKAEREKAVAENEKVKAEREMAVAETEKVKAEREKAIAETEKVKAEAKEAHLKLLNDHIQTITQLHETGVLSASAFDQIMSGLLEQKNKLQ